MHPLSLNPYLQMHPLSLNLMLKRETLPESHFDPTRSGRQAIKEEFLIISAWP